MLYIHQLPDWPKFTWDPASVLSPLGMVRHLQGRLSGKMITLGFGLQQDAELETLTQDVLKSNDIEGEFLDPGQVRSSIARRLGMDISRLPPSDRYIDGVVDVMMDATRNSNQPLSKERLFDWHAALFPTGRSGMYKIMVAGWRNDVTGPMEVVSGGIGRERVHFQAPAAAVLEKEMDVFIQWFNREDSLDPVIKAAIAHLWFITLHPFDDGNGRIARAIADMQLSKAEGPFRRFYSMSAQIRKERNQYYAILESTQKGDLDITEWLVWFLHCLNSALQNTDSMLAQVLTKANFWDKHRNTNLNDRQRLMLNKLFDGFEGKLNTSKWAKIAKCSADTALRDIQDLMNKGILQKAADGGRNTNYDLLT
ncbi:MAG: Fic family protein [Saprospiraceae bacterium]|nr:Fic family protein [Saprospiraceae bacterium]